MNQTMNKIFIIGLPRTGTTSVCAAMLDLGFRVAHTAYTDRSFNEAQVIADTPIFCDYQHLDKAYPDAKFIYLTRTMDKWLPPSGNCSLACMLILFAKMVGLTQ